MKGKYWFHKYENDSEQQTFQPPTISHFQSKKQENSSQTEIRKKAKIQRQQNDKSYIQQIQRHSNGLLKEVNKLIEAEKYYEKYLQEDFEAFVPMCFHHNAEIIFYCANDKKLVCSNCVYADKQKNKTTHPNKNSNIKKSINNQSTKSQSDGYFGHQKHNLRGLIDSTLNINTNLRQWNFSIKEQMNEIKSRNKKWNKLKQNFEKVKQKVLNGLQQKFDQIQAKLSKIYLKCKQQLTQFLQPFEKHLQSICSSYSKYRNMIPGNKYPLPILKHIWINLGQNIRSKIPPDLNIVENLFFSYIQGSCSHILKQMCL